MRHLKLFEQFMKKLNKSLESFEHPNSDKWQDKIEYLSELGLLAFCPLCNSLSLRLKEGSDKYKYFCLRCGGFEVTDSFLATDSIEKFSLGDRKKISSYIRSLYETSPKDDSIVLNNYSWKELLEQVQRLDISPLDKCSKFLLNLNSLSSFLGEKFFTIGLELIGQVTIGKIIKTIKASEYWLKCIEILRNINPVMIYYSPLRSMGNIFFLLFVYYFLESTSYIENVQEFKTIIDSLSKEGLISLEAEATFDFNPGNNVNLLWIFGLSLTLKGVREILDYQKRQANSSDKAFIAIQFSKDYESVGKAIEGAIKDAGFDPVQANKIPYADFAMDWILNRINESRFIVAELSSGNNGVYFEAGYALGKGIPVITCTKKITDEKGRDITFDNVHFDLRQYNTIVYESEEELKEKLRERIIHIVGYGPHYKESKTSYKRNS